MSTLPPFLVDLHCHTTFSHDGWQSPETVVRVAVERGAQIFSVTDHNQIGAQARAKAEADRLGIRYLTGVELEFTYPPLKRLFHYLAYGFDPEHPAMQALIDHQRGCYERQARAILDGFAAAGSDLDEAGLREWYRTRYEGNPDAQFTHRGIADWAIHRGWVADRPLFSKWMAEIGIVNPNLAPGKAYASLADGLEAVHAAGGVVLLAHVARYYHGDTQQQLDCIRTLMANGVDGFELYHPSNLADPGLPALEAFARELDCPLSCGSDTHRVDPLREESLFGRVPVPDWVAERLPQA